MDPADDKLVFAGKGRAPRRIKQVYRLIAKVESGGLGELGELKGRIGMIVKTRTESVLKDCIPGEQMFDCQQVMRLDGYAVADIRYAGTRTHDQEIYGYRVSGYVGSSDQVPFFTPQAGRYTSCQFLALLMPIGTRIRYQVFSSTMFLAYPLSLNRLELAHRKGIGLRIHGGLGDIIILL